MRQMDGLRGNYQVDATVRAMTQSSPWGSNQELSVRCQVDLDPQIVASVSVRAAKPGIRD
ncbi:hypothetical protein GCM10009825_37970 [Arthrobacter humicola]|uniref:Uncharacterized protein n=1 Tax=Arthrobacter humicola TaxID=409291 RepID=A0ABP5LDC0_9MICC